MYRVGQCSLVRPVDMRGRSGSDLTLFFPHKLLTRVQRVHCFYCAGHSLLRLKAVPYKPFLTRCIALENSIKHAWNFARSPVAKSMI